MIGMILGGLYVIKRAPPNVYGDQSPEGPVEGTHTMNSEPDLLKSQEDKQRDTGFEDLAVRYATANRSTTPPRATVRVKSAGRVDAQAVRHAAGTGSSDLANKPRASVRVKSARRVKSPIRTAKAGVHAVRYATPRADSSSSQARVSRRAKLDQASNPSTVRVSSRASGIVVASGVASPTSIGVKRPPSPPRSPSQSR